MDCCIYLCCVCITIYREDTVPAFTHVIEHLDKVVFKKTGYIKPDHRLYEFVKKHQHKDEVQLSTFYCRLLPCQLI